MTDTRARRAKKNILVSLGCQMITMLCGIIVPRLMIDAFGSEQYGATVSIGQFLSYIALLEGGVGGVARAVLYKPLAQEDGEAISEIMAEVKRFFRGIAVFFLMYVLLIACTFKAISRTEAFDWMTTFLLVTAISISTFGQYFIGISNSILLQAAQRSYVTNLVNIAGMLVNTVMIIVLIALDCSIVVVKLLSSVVFTIKPLLLWAYVQRRYSLQRKRKSAKRYLVQKWHAVGQHIAYFLHSNTDVVVLTCFANLNTVAIYSVYHMVVANIQNLAVTAVSGMEALFGDMLAKGEKEKLGAAFETYETMISIMAVTLFSVTAVMILPFVRIYTLGITDTDYSAPVFALLITLSALVYCLRLPYHAVITAAGHFRQTQLSAYGEAAINVILSILLVIRYGLVGVAVGTLAATSFRLVYDVFYLSRRILMRRIWLFFRRSALNAVVFFAIVTIGIRITDGFELANYGIWALFGALTTVIALAISVSANLLFYRRGCRSALAIWKAR